MAVVCPESAVQVRALAAACYPSVPRSLRDRSLYHISSLLYGVVYIFKKLDFNASEIQNNEGYSIHNVRLVETKSGTNLRRRKVAANLCPRSKTWEYVIYKGIDM